MTEENILVVPSVSFPEGLTPITDLKTVGDLQDKCISSLRSKAEENTLYRQIIPYGVLVSKDKEIFVTHRLGGDERLKGKYSIGTGGHTRAGETFWDGLKRELREEVGLEWDRDVYYWLWGCTYADNKTPVNQVHGGLFAFVVVDNKSNIKVSKEEKLEGYWATIEEVEKLAKDGLLEDWSIEAYNYFSTKIFNI